MTEDGMCISYKKENKIKNIESLYHATFECSSVEYIYNQIMTEFKIENKNLPLNAVSVVLSTVLNSTQGSMQL